MLGRSQDSLIGNDRDSHIPSALDIRHQITREPPRSLMGGYQDLLVIVQPAPQSLSRRLTSTLSMSLQYAIMYSMVGP